MTMNTGFSPEVDRAELERFVDCAIQEAQGCGTVSGQTEADVMDALDVL